MSTPQHLANHAASNAVNQAVSSEGSPAPIPKKTKDALKEYLLRLPGNIRTHVRLARRYEEIKSQGKTIITMIAFYTLYEYGKNIRVGDWLNTMWDINRWVYLLLVMILPGLGVGLASVYFRVRKRSKSREKKNIGKYVFDEVKPPKNLRSSGTTGTEGSDQDVKAQIESILDELEL